MIAKKELEKLEAQCVRDALKRNDLRTARAIIILAMLRPIPDEPTTPHGDE